MFTSIGALAIYVTDKQAAADFYTTALGFEMAADLGPDACFLRSPNGAIDVYLEGGMEPSSVDSSTARLSFFLRAEGSARDAFDSLRAAGVNLLQDAPEPVDDDTACFQLLDPDGNVLEVCGAR